jgi:threonine/homoserine/homoserine lactone efflux protein
LTRSEVIESLDPESSSTKPIGSPFRDGFLIAVTNPKIALFFLALFSQFVRPHAGWGEKIVMVVTAGTIDTLWYAVVALALSHSAILSRLRRWAVALDRIFGLVLIALAIRVAI